MRKSYANKVTDMLESLVRPHKMMNESEAIKPFKDHSSFDDMMQEIKTLKPVYFRKACRLFLNKVLKLKFSKGELQPDKDLDWWSFAIFDWDDYYSFVLEFPVNWQKCPEKYRGIEKYHTRDVLSKDGFECDLDTSDLGLAKELPADCTVYNVSFLFTVSSN